MADVVHSPEESRYEIRVDGVQAGFARYRSTPAALVFDHTSIEDAYAGHGLGGQLAGGALDDVRANGLKVVAECPFIKAWIDRHEDYQDLLVA